MIWISDYQRWLTVDESLNNSQLIINHFVGTDWTRESLSAMCGNMRHESSCNPNMYEYGYDWSADRGFGLVQWTPRSKYWDWAIAQGFSNPRDGDSQLARIDYEVENNIQWLANGHSRRYGKADKFDFSFAEFRTNAHGLNVDQLTEAFMWNYEGPNYTAGSTSLGDRIQFANLVLNEVNFEGVEPGPQPKPEQDGADIYALWLSGALRW